MGKIAVVTGASSGIGAEIARGLAHAGWRCVLIARREDRLRTLAEETDGEFEVCDVADRAAVEATAARVLERHPQIGLLVNNAGVAGRASFLDSDPAAIENVIRVNYLGGERAVPHYNVMGVAKATLDASMRYLAWDLGEKNIRVNAVSAGPVRTLAARSIAGFPTMEAIVEERAPLHRHVTAEDVGAAAAYLLGDGAKNVTGTTLYVDSGYHAMGM